MNLYPINLNLKTDKVLIVGGGQVAYRKLKRLLDYQVKITLISPEVNEAIKELIKKERIIYQQREFIDKDINDYFLVFATTDNKEVNQRIAKLADRNKILVNVADSLELSTFSLPAVLKRGDLLLAVATGGNLPALSKKIRERLELEFGAEYGHFLDLMKEIRPFILRKVEDERKRRKIFRNLANLELIGLLAEDKEKGINRIKEILSQEIKEEFNLDLGVKL